VEAILHNKAMSANIPQQILTFGQRLRRIRKAMGLTQEQLAERVAMHRTDLSDLENDKHSPLLKTIGRLAVGLGVPISSLLEDH
jgi:transcriptional regulator with XRE-family HTH domain